MATVTPTTTIPVPFQACLEIVTAPDGVTTLQEKQNAQGTEACFQKDEIDLTGVKVDKIDNKVFWKFVRVKKITLDDGFSDIDEYTFPKTLLRDLNLVDLTLCETYTSNYKPERFKNINVILSDKTKPFLCIELKNTVLQPRNGATTADKAKCATVTNIDFSTLHITNVSAKTFEEFAGLTTIKFGKELIKIDTTAFQTVANSYTKIDVSDSMGLLDTSGLAGFTTKDLSPSTATFLNCLQYDSATSTVKSKPSITPAKCVTVDLSGQKIFEIEKDAFKALTDTTTVKFGSQPSLSEIVAGTFNRNELQKLKASTSTLDLSEVTTLRIPFGEFDAYPTIKLHADLTVCSSYAFKKAGDGKISLNPALQNKDFSTCLDLDLSNMGITSVADNTFKKFTKLGSLNLNNNQWGAFPSKLTIPTLKYLYFKNCISKDNTLPDNAFAGMPNALIYMENNNVVAFSNNTFKGFKGNILMPFNKISTLTNETVNSMQGNITLTNNTIKCCENEEVLESIADRNLNFSYTCTDRDGNYTNHINSAVCRDAEMIIHSFKLSSTAIALIVVGSIIAVCLIGGLIFTLWWFQQKKAKLIEERDDFLETTEAVCLEDEELIQSSDALNSEESV
eukprot:Pgem_evm1s16763